MKDSQTKPPNPKSKSKTGVPKSKMPAKKLKDQKTKPSKEDKVKKPRVKNKKIKPKKEDGVVALKRKRGRPRNEDRVQPKKKAAKVIDPKPSGRKRKMPISANIKCEKELSRPPLKKPKTNDTNCNMNGNIKAVLPNHHKPYHQIGQSPSLLEPNVVNHMNSNGTFHCKKSIIDFNQKPPVNNTVFKNTTSSPQQIKKELLNGKSFLKAFKPNSNQNTKTKSKCPSDVTPQSTNKLEKPIELPKVTNIIVPYREPIKLHPQRMASLDAMAKLHVICIPDRKPIEHHSRTTTSVVTVCSQPSSHQKSVTQVHESIHFDLKKEGKGNIVHKQINYVKEKQEVFVSHSVEQSSVLEQSKTSSIKSEIEQEKKKKTKPSLKSIVNSAQKKDSKSCESAIKSAEALSAKSEKSKNSKNNKVAKDSAKISKQIKKPVKDKTVVKASKNKSKKLDQTKSEVKVKETIRMQKTCTYQSVTTVNSHATTNSSVVPVSHVGMTTNYSKTKKTVVTDEECKNLNYSSGNVINKSYCVTSDSPCSLTHQTECCKFHTHTSPHIIPFAHVQTCSLGHGISSNSSSSTSSHCDGSFALHKFQHQQPLIYSSPSQDYGCCCSGALVQNVPDSCLLRKSIVALPHHFSHHTHLPSSAFSHESLCTDYHPSNTSIDATKHNAQFSLAPSTSHPRVGCYSCCDLHSREKHCHHQSAGSCLQYISSPKSSTNACEQSPLDLSLTSVASGSSLVTSHPHQHRHYPSPLCCAGELLLLRTSAHHGFQHSAVTCCQCTKPISCGHTGVKSVQCSGKNLENRSQTLQIVDKVTPVAVAKGSILPPAPPPAANIVNKKTPLVMTDNLVQAKVEKSISPKLSPKVTAPKKRQFTHGWSWKGKPKEKLIALTNDSTSCLRLCYPSIQHQEGDVINERDCVLLRSGPKDTDLPYVAKVVALWENPEDGEMMMSLLWYYRPEHTDQGRKLSQMEDEVFASRHKDVNSIACIEDKCYVLTYSEYCRYRASISMDDDITSLAAMLIPDPPDEYPRRNRLPIDAVSSDIVFFCRHVYDFRQKRILKNPT